MQELQTKQSIKLADFLENYNSQQKIHSIPLEFQYVPVQILSKEFTKLKSQHQYKIHYLGPRYINTMMLHKRNAQSQQSPFIYNNCLSLYPYLKKYQINTKKIVQSYFMAQKMKNHNFYKSALYYRAFQGMNPSLEINNEFVFNSAFQSGNLDCVVKVNPNQFDLFLRIDSNTRRHINWFYFSVKNNKNRQKVRFNLCNLNKPKALYGSGMKPYVYSEIKYKNTGRKWEQDGKNLGYDKKQLRYDFIYKKTSVPTLYCLTIEYDFDIQNDEVYFAYCVPYTYSQMLQDINQLDPKYVKIEKLGRSLGGVDIPILHITNHQANKKKKNVFITARIHPGQTNSSHVLLGFMRFACSEKKQAQDLRNIVNLFIVPMVNPDGVIVGNTRTSLAGKDLNRQYISPIKDLYPEIYNIKNLVQKLQLKHNIILSLDFHGHSRKKNTFLYGPTYHVNEPEYYKCRIIPKLIQKLNNSFRFYSCSFKITEEKKKTSRASMFEQYNIPYTYTIQSSIGYFYDSVKMITYPFQVENWNSMGASICCGTSTFFVGYQEYQLFLKERRQLRRIQKSKTEKPLFKNMKLNAIEQCEENLIEKNSALRIFYNKDSLFAQVLEELKNTENQIDIKEMDDDCQSDDHDQKQDLQLSKLAEFNNLVIQNAKKENLVTNLKICSYSNQSKKSEIIRPFSALDEQKMDEIKLLKQMIRPKTSNANYFPIFIQKKRKQLKMKKRQNIQDKNYLNITVKGSFQPSITDRPKSVKIQGINKANSIKKNQYIKTIDFRAIQTNIVCSQFRFPQNFILDLPISAINSDIVQSRMSGGFKRKIKRPFNNRSITHHLSQERRQKSNTMIQQKSKKQIQFNELFSNLNKKSLIFRQSLGYKSKKKDESSNSFLGNQRNTKATKKSQYVTITTQNLHFNDNESQGFTIKTLKKN